MKKPTGGGRGGRGKDRRAEAVAKAIAKIAARKARSVAKAESIELRGAALEAQTCWYPEFILAGPRDTSKSWGGLFRLDSEGRKWTNSRWAIVRKVRAHMNTSVLVTWERISGLRGGWTKHGGDNPTHYTRADNGARVDVIGLDVDTRTLSSEYDGIFVNQAEELSRGDWEALAACTSGRGAVVERTMLWGDCNPGPPTHWILHRPRLRMLEAKHEDNPEIYAKNPDGTFTLTEKGAERIAALDAYTGVKKLRMRYGRWAAAEGTVYEGSYERSQNVVDYAFLLDKGIVKVDSEPGVLRLNRDVVRDVVAGVDWGYTAPGTILIAAKDGDGRLYVIHEVYRTRKLINWWLDQALMVRDLYGVSAFACDPSEPANIASFKRAGLPAIKGWNPLKPGIDEVAARFQLAGDGRPRLYIYDNSLRDRDEALANANQPTCLVDELEAYVWPKGADGKPQKDLIPVPGNDHANDGLRYLSAHASGRRTEEHGTAWLEMARQAESGAPLLSQSDVVSEPSTASAWLQLGAQALTRAATLIEQPPQITDEEIRNVYVPRTRPDDNP